MSASLGRDKAEDGMGSSANDVDVRVWLEEALDAVVDLGQQLGADIRRDRSPGEIFAACKPTLRRLANFETIAFLSIDQDGLGFDVDDVDPGRSTSMLRKELEHLVTEGTFAWSVYQNRPVLVPARFMSAQVVLHVLATPSKVVGMFVGVLPSGSAYMPDVVQKILTILMQNTAGVMESALLYRDLNRHNQNLEATIEERTRDLRKSEAEARQASKVRSEFLANMSHEIRTPINGIVGMNSLMMEGKLEGEQREQAETIQRSAETLLTIINDILDLSKIEAGLLALESLPYDLRLSVEDVVELLSTRAFDKGIEVLAAFPPAMPQMFLGDVSRVRQVLTNLVGNAVKFTKQGHVLVRVQWAPDTGKSGKLRIDVEDTGIGIEPDKLEMIFDKFTQADTSTTRVYGGTGLGLSISRQLIGMMGGELTASSVPGEGSTFSLSIPVSLTEDAAGPDDRGVLAGQRVLIVSPSWPLREALSQDIANWRGTPVCASGLDDVRRLCAERVSPPSVVLIDFAISGSELFEMRHVLQELSGSEARTILMTDMSARTEAIEWLGKGFEGLLLKPVRESRLRVALLGRQEPVKEAGPEPTVSQHRSGRVLVVEDDPVNRAVATQMLKRFGHSVELASNGQEAVDKIADLRPGHFDLVLMDCQMPVMDGYEATRQIRALDRWDTPMLPIVALTASVLEEDRHECLAAGMDDFCTKPVRVGDIEQLLDRWIGDGAPLVEKEMSK